MNARSEMAVVTSGVDIGPRIGAIDWAQVVQDLDANGCALIERLLMGAECDALRALYPNDALFRSRIVMERHGFGRGEYKYFAYPLPAIVAELRTTLYPCLAPIANHWNKVMDIDVRYRHGTRTSSSAVMRQVRFVRRR